MNADVVIIKLLCFMSGCKRLEPRENTVDCMTGFLSSNGRISVQFDDIDLKFSPHAYFKVRFHSTLSKYENSKTRFSP